MTTQTVEPAPAERDDEIVIDLAKYARILLSHWKSLISLSLAGALVGLGVSFAFPAPYEAVAGVAMVKTRTNVEFDTRITTTGPDSSPQTTGTAEGRRTALVGLVQNGTIAQTLAKQFANRLAPQDREPGALLRKVTSDAGTGNRSELISIRVRDTDAQLATDLANAWAAEYEKQANTIFGGAPTDYANSIKVEFDRANKDLDKAQAELEAFIGKNSIDQLSRQISETLSVLSTLQRDRQSALFNAQFDAVNEQQVALVREQTNSRLAQLKNLYEAKVRVTSMRDEAAAMRAQVRAGGDDAASTNSLALISLKSRAFGQELPQLQLNDLPKTTAVAQLKDLDALVSSLEARLIEVDAQISTQSRQLGEPVAIAPPVTGPRPQLSAQSTSESDAATIARLQTQVAAAQAKIEGQRSEQQKLTQARDLARSTFSTLASKREEVSIAAAVTGSEVRFASPAVVPAVRTQGRAIYVGVGLLAGLLLGLAWVVWRQYDGAAK